MYEETTRRLLKLMKDTFGDHFKAYYDGDPDQIPTFNLPCIIVDQTNDETERGTWGEDDITETVMIKAIYNKADDYSNNVDPLNLTSRKLRRIVGARDKQTGDYRPDTIKSALRTFGTEGLTAVAPNLSVQYGLVPRLEGDVGILTQEAHVQFTIRYSVDVKPAA